MEDVDTKHNPWLVEQLEDFLFYCCPECEIRSSTRDTFINHAFLQHPLVSKIVKAFEQGV
jgi:hypothetical protein